MLVKKRDRLMELGKVSGYDWISDGVGEDGSETEERFEGIFC